METVIGIQMQVLQDGAKIKQYMIHALLVGKFQMVVQKVFGVELGLMKIIYLRVESMEYLFNWTTVFQHGIHVRDTGAQVLTLMVVL